MFRNIETDRLLLKCISGEDDGFFYKEFSNEAVNRYLFDTEPCRSIEDAREWIDFFTVPEPRDRHRWVIILKTTGERIGTCGFHCLNEETGGMELGYDLYPTYWRQGYATEALTAIIAFAKKEMRAVWIDAHISVDNIPSIKTAVKQGFEKTEKSYFEKFHGQSYLHNVYRLVL